MVNSKFLPNFSRFDTTKPSRRGESECATGWPAIAYFTRAMGYLKARSSSTSCSKIKRYGAGFKKEYTLAESWSTRTKVKARD